MRLKRVSDQTGTHCYWIRMILRSWIWKIYTEVWLPPRSPGRLHLFSSCGRARIFWSDITHNCIYAHRLSRILYCPIGEGSICKVSCRRHQYMDSYTSLYQYWCQSQYCATHRSDTSICELWWIFTLLSDDGCWYDALSISTYGISSTKSLRYFTSKAKSFILEWGDTMLRLRVPLLRQDSCPWYLPVANWWRWRGMQQ